MLVMTLSFTVVDILNNDNIRDHSGRLASVGQPDAKARRCQKKKKTPVVEERQLTAGEANSQAGAILPLYVITGMVHSDGDTRLRSMNTLMQVMVY